jgi:hypothetical protein
VKKHRIPVRLFLPLFLSLVVAIVYGARGLYAARTRQAAERRTRYTETCSIHVCDTSPKRFHRSAHTR